MRALIACLLWLAGVEVLPAVHLAAHDAASHHHDGDHVVSDDPADRHEDDVHVDVDREIGKDQIDHAPHHHGAGGLAHRATAIAPPAPPPAIAPPSAHVSFATVYVAAAHVSRSSFAPSARGPPDQVSTFI